LSDRLVNADAELSIEVVTEVVKEVLVVDHDVVEKTVMIVCRPVLFVSCLMLLIISERHRLFEYSVQVFLKMLVVTNDVAVTP
jgi:hypothetical protein